MNNRVSDPGCQLSNPADEIFMDMRLNYVADSYAMFSGKLDVGVAIRPRINYRG
jgi:hypothetical protein